MTNSKTIKIKYFTDIDRLGNIGDLVFPITNKDAPSSFSILAAFIHASVNALVWTEGLFVLSVVKP